MVILNAKNKASPTCTCSSRDIPTGTRHHVVVWRRRSKPVRHHGPMWRRQNGGRGHSTERHQPRSKSCAGDHQPTTYDQSTNPYTRVFICKYRLKRCSKKKCCKQCRQVKFKDTLKIWKYGSNKNKHLEEHRTCRTTGRNRQSENNFFFFWGGGLGFFHCYIYIVLFIKLLKKMLGYHLGTVNGFHWGFKQFIANLALSRHF